MLAEVLLKRDPRSVTDVSAPTLIAPSAVVAAVLLRNPRKSLNFAVAGTELSFINSIFESDGVVSLVNDESNPGPSEYYGTDSNGDLGYHAIPAIASGGSDGGVTFIDSIIEDSAGNVSLVNDDPAPTPSEYYGTDSDGTLGYHAIPDPVLPEFIDSVIEDSAGNVSLVNDENTPAAARYYGTNGAGVRGWYPFFSTAGGGSDGGVTFIDSITADSDGNVSLVNDDPAPGAARYYGTDSISDLGYHALPVDDTAYDAATWDGVTTAAPSKNAVRDKFESLSSITTNQKLAAVGVTIDGAGVAITTGSKGYLTVPYDCTITRATMLADQTGSIVVEVRKCTYSQFDAGSTHPVTGDKINNTTPPTISGATKSDDPSLTSWVTSVTAGDVLEFYVNSCSTIQRVNLVLKVTKS